MNQQVRIISGLYRGRKITFPDIAGLRPTPDRVKETLFNWLMPWIVNARCLDAFAGSGALGFEALSRGAGHCVMIEYEKSVVINLTRTKKILNAQAATIIHMDTRIYLTQPNLAFDIIFLDPPFASDHLVACIEQLTHNNCLKQSGLLYVESSYPCTLNSAYWQVLHQKKAKHVHYALYKKY